MTNIAIVATIKLMTPIKGRKLRNKFNLAIEKTLYKLKENQN